MVLRVKLAKKLEEIVFSLKSNCKKIVSIIKTGVSSIPVSLKIFWLVIGVAVIFFLFIILIPSQPVDKKANTPNLVKPNHHAVVSQSNSPDKSLLLQIQQQLKLLHTNNQQNSENLKTQQELAQLANNLSYLVQQEKYENHHTQASISNLAKQQEQTQQQAVDVQRQLTAIHKAVVPQRYLPSTVLPFQIEGISYWNGEPMLTISMRGTNGEIHYKLLAKGNAYGCLNHQSRQHGCNRWMVKSINTDNDEVLLNNQQGLFVRVVV